MAGEALVLKIVYIFNGFLLKLKNPFARNICVGSERGIFVKNLTRNFKTNLIGLINSPCSDPPNLSSRPNG